MNKSTIEKIATAWDSWSGMRPSARDVEEAVAAVRAGEPVDELDGFVAGYLAATGEL